jgi:hypothetical protein
VPVLPLNGCRDAAAERNKAVVDIGALKTHARNSWLKRLTLLGLVCRRLPHSMTSWFQERRMEKIINTLRRYEQRGQMQRSGLILTCQPGTACNLLAVAGLREVHSTNTCPEKSSEYASSIHRPRCTYQQNYI